MKFGDLVKRKIPEDSRVYDICKHHGADFDELGFVTSQTPNPYCFVTFPASGKRTKIRCDSLEVISASR
jgi:hypothetical protein